MNRQSVNTVLLIICLGMILYTLFLVSQRPTIQEIESRIDTIVAARYNANRAIENSRLKRCIHETLDERNADLSKKKTAENSRKSGWPQSSTPFRSKCVSRSHEDAETSDCNFTAFLTSILLRVSVAL